MKRIAVILILALIMSLAAGCAHQPATNVTAPSLIQPQAYEPALEEVTTGIFYTYFASDCYVVPYTQSLYFPISGIIGQVLVYPGMTVEKGDVLAVLDHSGLTQRAASLEAELSNIRTAAEYSDKLAKLQISILEVELRQLESQLPQQEQPTEGEDTAEALAQLNRQIALKKNELAQAKTDLRQEQELREARTVPKYEELARIQEEIAQCYLYAPFSGRIAYETTLVVGQAISATSPALALSDESRMLLDPSSLVFEDILDAAKSVSVRIGALDYDVERIPPTEQEMLIAEQNNTYPDAFFEVLGTPEELAQLEFGQFGVLTITSNYLEDVIVVPVSAVWEASTDVYCVYVHENGKRVKRDVEIGGFNGSAYHIKNGLKEGEIIYVG